MTTDIQQLLSLHARKSNSTTKFDILIGCCD